MISISKYDLHLDLKGKQFESEDHLQVNQNHHQKYKLTQDCSVTPNTVKSTIQMVQIHSKPPVEIINIRNLSLEALRMKVLDQ